MLLQRTLQTEFVPGSNLEDQAAAAADWRFLAHDPAPRAVLCLDEPRPETREYLASSVPRVWVLGGAQPDAGPFSRLEPPAGRGARMSLPSGEVDVVLAETPRALQRLGGGRGLAAEVARVLAPRGTVWVEAAGLAQRRPQRRALARLEARGVRAGRGYWLTPRQGAMRTAAPLGDPRAGAYLFASTLFGRSRANRALGRLGRVLSRTSWFDFFYPRRVVVAGRPAANSALPAYLEEGAGERVDPGCRLLVSARGRYRSNKIVYFLFPGGADRPEWVVKVSRTVEFAGRLEHEFQALRQLEQRGVQGVPRAEHLAHHGGRAILWLRAAAGAPLQGRSRAGADCPWAAAAVRWLTRLGEVTARPASAADLKQALGSVFEKFVRIYQLDGEQRRRLEEAVQRLSGAGTSLPSVFQHGDPGVQNILVRGDADVCFLDWESSEAEGMPLWDLFYFLRTYVQWAEALRGRRDPLANFRAHFLREGRFTPWISAAVEGCRRRLNLDPALLGPLFVTCWMHRCLKESILLPPDRLERGTYIRLLREALAGEALCGAGRRGRSAAGAAAPGFLSVPGKAFS